MPSGTILRTHRVIRDPHAPIDIDGFRECIQSEITYEAKSPLPTIGECMRSADGFIKRDAIMFRVASHESILMATKTVRRDFEAKLINFFVINLPEVKSITGRCRGIYNPCWHFVFRI